MKSVFNDAYAILFSVFFIEAYVVGTHLIASTCRGNSNEYPQHMFLYRSR